MIHIRRAQPQEAAAIASIMLLAMEEIVYYIIGQANKEEAIAFLTHFVQQEGNQYSYENCFVATENDILLGQITLYPGEQLEALRKPILDYIEENYQRTPQLEDETQAGEIYLDTIAVSPLAQGKGIGKKLLQHVIDYYTVQRNECIGLLVEKSNPGAKKLYLQMGFVEKDVVHIFNKEMDHLQRVAKAIN